MVAVRVLIVLFGSHILRALRFHILGVLALFVRSLFPRSALLAVQVASLGGVHRIHAIHIVHAIHAIFILHYVSPPLHVGKSSLCRVGEFIRIIFGRG